MSRTAQQIEAIEQQLEATKDLPSMCRKLTPSEYAHLLTKIAKAEASVRKWTLQDQSSQYVVDKLRRARAKLEPLIKRRDRQALIPLQEERNALKRQLAKLQRFQAKLDRAAAKEREALAQYLITRYTVCDDGITTYVISKQSGTPIQAAQFNGKAIPASAIAEILNNG